MRAGALSLELRRLIFNDSQTWSLARKFLSSGFLPLFNLQKLFLGEGLGLLNEAATTAS